MTPQRRLPSYADLRQRMPPLQAPSAELIRNECVMSAEQRGWF
jgi:hypothetical protein